MESKIRKRQRKVDVEEDSEEKKQNLQPVANGMGYKSVTRAAPGMEVQKTEVIQVPDYGDTPVARVRVMGGVTEALGDFNFIKVEVAIEMPCFPTDDEVKSMYNHLGGLVDEMVRNEIAVAKGGNEDASSEED